MKKTLFSVLLFLLFVVFFSACNPSEVKVVENTESFFDLKAYFKKELSQLGQLNTINKTVEINGHREEKNSTNVDFQEELSSFTDADINRLAWRDKYQVDSIRSDEGLLLELRYAGIHSDMKTQTLIVYFKNNVVDRIIIETQVNGFATQNRKNMEYIPRVGYSIKSKQKTLLGAEQNITIEVKII